MIRIRYKMEAWILIKFWIMVKILLWKMPKQNQLFLRLLIAHVLIFRKFKTTIVCLQRSRIWFNRNLVWNLFIKVFVKLTNNMKLITMLNLITVYTMILTSMDKFQKKRTRFNQTLEKHWTVKEKKSMNPNRPSSKN